MSSELALGGFWGGIGLSQVGYRLGAHLVQEWYSAVPGVAQGWMSGGGEWVQGSQGWQRVALGFAHSWVRVGAEVVPSCLRSATGWIQAWFRSGTGLAQGLLLVG